MKIETDKMQQVGENLFAEEVEGKLVLVLDTQYEGGLSSTGKMRCVASTSGFVQFPGGLKGNLYIGRKAK